MINSKIVYIIFTICSLSTYSCVKDKPNKNGSNPDINGNPKLIIANEGVFNGGNASLSYLDLATQKIYNDVYYAQNERVLGDVLQSIAGDSNNLYLVVNNSNKIITVDKKTFKYKSELSIAQPRYLCLLGNNKALVSSMYRSKLHVVDLNTNQITKEINVAYPNTEGMIVLNNKVYICPWNTQCNYIYQFDITTERIEDSIYISNYAPTQVIADKNNKLWVFAGNPYLNIKASITQIDPQTKQILKSFNFTGSEEIIKPIFNPSKDAFYYLAVLYSSNSGNDYNGLYKMSIEATQTPATALVKAQALQYFWGLGVNPENGNIFLGDPKGFIQSGTVSEYTDQGVLKNTYTVGLGPGFFYFD
ncbi:MAG: hypothetical protein EOP54_15965 [Sphingobacteriales bacterium]|nr:MAG: hypothetical protein EOP54_15965 [Sphingobacteriales bacterium]